MDGVHLTDRNLTYEYYHRTDTTNGTLDSIDWVESHRRKREAMERARDLERGREQVAIFDFDGEQAQRESAERMTDAMRHFGEELKRVSAKTENLVEALRGYNHQVHHNDDTAVWVAH